MSGRFWWKYLWIFCSCLSYLFSFASASASSSLQDSPADFSSVLLSSYSSLLNYSFDPHLDYLIVPIDRLGLANRLRILSSASALATLTSKKLLILWQPSHECSAPFSSLFEIKITETPQTETNRETETDSETDTAKASSSSSASLSSLASVEILSIPFSAPDLSPENLHRLFLSLSSTVSCHHSQPSITILPQPLLFLLARSSARRRQTSERWKDSCSSYENLSQPLEH
jgi:hypothetical protein